jgi:uncharacterized repeat protein (TIGR01451 family)
LPVEVDFDHWVERPGGASQSNDEITWSGTIMAGEVITFTFVARHVGAYGDVVTNVAGYSHADSGTSGDDDATFTVLGLPDVVIDKTVTPATDVTYHGTVTYTIVLSSSSGSDAAGVLLTDTLPVEVDFDHWVERPSGASQSNDEITWSGTVMASEVITFVFVAQHVGDYNDVVTNVAEYSHADSGSSGQDDAIFTVPGPPGIEIDKMVTPTTDVAYHGMVTYTILLGNNGSSDAIGVLLTDTLPVEVDFDHWIERPGGAGAGGDEITWRGTVAAGAAVTFTFAARHVGAYGDVVTNVAEYSYASDYGHDEATFVVEAAGYTYLPVVLRNVQSPPPDLVVHSIIATRNDIQVVIKNQGEGRVDDDFWVDAYINPDPVPTTVNDTWAYVAEEGLVWGVRADLQPGEVITLTFDDRYYWARLSRVSWPLPVGAAIYAQVDSAHTGTTYGGVLEAHEIEGRPYNNIAGPVYVLDDTRR